MTRLCSTCDHPPHTQGNCTGCFCIANNEIRPRTGINDGPAGSIRDARPTAARVPDSIIGNILDHWQMLPGDTRQDIKDTEPGFYGAMERLTDWIEENR